VSDAPVRVSADWLALREAADGAARATDLATTVAGLVRPGVPTLVHDVGCGTGAMGRWLAPRLPGPQHWVLTDRDPDLLAVAAAALPGAGADGSPVTAAPRHRDLATLTAADLSGAALLTASALLDLLTPADLERLVDACVGAACPALLVLSVTGRVRLAPTDPLDTALAAAFNAHQRRTVAGGRLLGPDAVTAAVALFARPGWRVRARSSPWRLGAGESALARQWLAGWVGAACEQCPALAGPGRAYLRRRLAQAAAGRLELTVHHQDLLAFPAGRSAGRR
jgi:SAM-dependent methyltransferase